MAHLAGQVGVPAEVYMAYDWRGRAIKESEQNRGRLRGETLPLK